MTPDHTSRELVELLQGTGQGNADDCVLTTAWRTAEQAAADAYEAWRVAPEVDAYVAYLAAEERAAAAEERLRSWAAARDAYAADGGLRAA